MDEASIEPYSSPPAVLNAQQPWSRTRWTNSDAGTEHQSTAPHSAHTAAVTHTRIESRSHSQHHRTSTITINNDTGITLTLSPPLAMMDGVPTDPSAELTPLPSLGAFLSSPVYRSPGGVEPHLEFQLRRRIRSIRQNDRLVHPAATPAIAVGNAASTQVVIDTDKSQTATAAAALKAPLPDVSARPAAVGYGKLVYRIRHHGPRHWCGQLEYGLRLGAAAVLAGSITSLIPAVQGDSWLVIPYFLPFIALLVTAFKLGQTLSVCLQICQGAAVSIFLCWVALVSGLGPSNRWQGGIVIFFLELFCLYFFRDKPFAKKGAGAVIVIVVLLGINNPAFASNKWVWHALSEILCGLALALALEIFLFPPLSTLELHYRWWQSWRLVERQIVAAVQSYMAIDNDQLIARRAELDTFRRAAKENLAQLKARAGESGLERAFIPPWQLLWPYYWIYGSKYGWLEPSSLIPAMEKLLDCVEQLAICIETLQTSEYHAEFQDWMSEPLTDFSLAVRRLAAAVGEVRYDRDEINAAQAAVQASWNRCFTRWQRARYVINSFPNIPAELCTEELERGFNKVPVERDSVLQLGVTDLGNHSLFITCLDMMVASMVATAPPATPPTITLGTALMKYATLLLCGPYVLKVDVPGLKIAIKVSTILLLVSMPWLIYESVDHFTNGYWIPIAVAFTYADIFGLAVYTALLRVLGTMIGACFGALVVNAVIQQDTTILDPLDRSRYGWMIALLFLWMLACAPFRLHPRWSYGGTVAIFTAPIILFGWSKYGVLVLSPADLALVRIQENVIGVLVYLLVDYLWWPNTATSKLAAVLKTNLRAVQRTSDGALQLYSRAYRSAAADIASKEPAATGAAAAPTASGLLADVKKCREGVATLDMLLPLAMWEPPVPQLHCHGLTLYQPEVGALHQQLMAAQTRITHLNSLLIACIERVTSERAQADLVLIRQITPQQNVDQLQSLIAKLQRLLDNLFMGHPHTPNIMQLPPLPRPTTEKEDADPLHKADDLLLELRVAVADAATAGFRLNVEGRAPVVGLYLYASFKAAEYVAALIVQRLMDVVVLTRKMARLQLDVAAVSIDRL